VRYELKEIKYQDSADALQHNKLLLMLKSVNQKPTPINDLSNLNSLTYFIVNSQQSDVAGHPTNGDSGHVREMTNCFIASGL
jgi:hypothetical protein